MAKIAANISEGLRHDLIEAAEKSGRTLTAEVEARLRESLGSKASDGLLLLKLDAGLWAWLKAYRDGYGLWRDLEDCAVYSIRSQVIEASKGKAGLAIMLPHLPADIQAAVGRHFTKE